MRRIFLTLMLVLGASRAFASLSVIANVSPSSAAVGGTVTLILQVTAGSNTVTGITPAVSISSGSAVLETGPLPTSMTLTANAVDDFTYTYSVTGCGDLVFSTSATGMENLAPVISNPFSTLRVTVSCPYSPTPTSTPTPYVDATPTPQVVYVTATPVPGKTDAKILGNMFHPLQGGTVGLRYVLPQGGTLLIHIYNRQGQVVKTIQTQVAPGEGTQTWDGRNDEGDVVASGIYLVLFQGDGLNKVAKLVVIK